MTTEDYNLLVKDLCNKLPYGLKVQIKLPNYQTQEFDEEIGEAWWINMASGLIDVNSQGIDYNISMERVKPCLRLLSSMTKEEEEEYHNVCVCPTNKQWNVTDWLDQHHFDYRDLIKKGLAIEAPKNMYN